MTSSILGTFVLLVDAYLTDLELTNGMSALGQCSVA